MFRGRGAGACVIAGGDGARGAAHGGRRAGRLAARAGRAARPARPVAPLARALPRRLSAGPPPSRAARRLHQC